MNKKNHLGDETSWKEMLDYIKDNKDNIDFKIELKKTHISCAKKQLKREKSNTDLFKSFSKILKDYEAELADLIKQKKGVK